MSDHWKLILSDEVIITDLISNYAGNELIAKYIWSIEDLKSVLTDGEVLEAVLFLLDNNEKDKLLECIEPLALSASSNYQPFFVNQLSENSCCTIGLSNILLNLDKNLIKKSSILARLHDFCKGLDTHYISEVFNSNDDLLKLHNAYARSEFSSLFQDLDSTVSKDTQEVYHYVGLVPKIIDGKRQILFLDGLLPTVYRVKLDFTASDDISSMLQRAMSTLTSKLSSSVNFMAIIRIPRNVLKNELSVKRSELKNAIIALGNSKSEGNIDKVAVREKIKNLSDDIEHISLKLAYIKDQSDKNSASAKIIKAPIPLIYFKILRTLAGRGVLSRSLASKFNDVNNN